MIDDNSFSEDAIVETPVIPEGALLILINEEVADSEEEDSDDDKVWEITREEFEDKVVDAWGESPEL